jgi:hypothetical protein
LRPTRSDGIRHRDKNGGLRISSQSSDRAAIIMRAVTISALLKETNMEKIDFKKK